MHRRYPIFPGHSFFKGGRDANQSRFISKGGRKLHPDGQTGLTFPQWQGNRRRARHVEQPHVLEYPEIIFPEFMGLQIVPFGAEFPMGLRQ